MRTLLIATLLLTIAGATWYGYQEFLSRCQTPIAYSVTVPDERFGITHEEAIRHVADAVALWESGVGEDLFVYDPDGELVVRFVYDARQRLTDTESELRDILDRKESLTQSLRESYEALITEYGDARELYEAEVEAYQERLAAYNEEVAKWNEQGGATSEEYDRLNKERDALDVQNEALQEQSEKLNAMVEEINELGQEGNAAIDDYNQNVNAYNNLNHPREFTQGDYQNHEINIYQFEDVLELQVVLAHELGHALSIGHVENERSIMHFLMEGQHEELALTAEDIAAYEAVCGA